MNVKDSTPKAFDKRRPEGQGKGNTDILCILSLWIVLLLVIKILSQLFYYNIRRRSQNNLLKRFDFAKPTKLPKCQCHCQSPLNSILQQLYTQNIRRYSEQLTVLLLPCWLNCYMSCNRQFGGSRALLNWCFLHCFLTTVSVS